MTPARSLTVAVLGAGGTIAPAIVHDLAVSNEVDRLLLLDLDQERADQTAAAHGAGKASAFQVDARAPGELATKLADADVLVNTASYRINLDAMAECLKAGCDYLDLGGLYWLTKRQLELGEEFERAGLLAILGIGSSPGKTNLMAARAVEELGSTPTELHVAAAGRDPDAANDGRLHPPYAIQTLLDELTLKPVVLRDGEPVEIEPLSDGGELDYGDPIGAAQTIYTLHSELATFGRSFGCSAASFRLSLAPRLLEALKELTTATPEQVADAAAHAATPSSNTVSVHLVRAQTAQDTVTVRAVTRPHFGLGGSVVSTAAPIAAATRLLARGSVGAKGVYPPERCLDPEEMFAELETRGCTFSVER